MHKNVLSLYVLLPTINRTAYELFTSFVCVMNYSNLYFFIVFTTLIVQCYSFTGINWYETFDNSSLTIPTTPDDDIYKCVSYTGAHVDTLHWINQNFSDYKDCQTSGLYTLNRIDRQFKVDIDVQRSWIVEVNSSR